MVRSTYRRRGAGYLMPSEYFNPNARQPAAASDAVVPSSAPVSGWVRPVLSATTSGGSRSTRKMRGGFAPALMGAFAANAQSAVVPLALLALYSVFGAKSSPNTKRATPNLAKRVSANKSGGGIFNTMKNKKNMKDDLKKDDLKKNNLKKNNNLMKNMKNNSSKNNAQNLPQVS